MGNVVYVAHDGHTQSVELDDGVSLMEGAVSAGVRGIDGDCGGNCSCATCHVYVAPAWASVVGPPASEMEAALLELAPSIRPESRLACQIKMREELNGVTVLLPAAQH